jgi:hypothetical protein
MKNPLIFLKELLHNSRKSVLLQEETFALNQLNTLFNEDVFFPLTIWSISPSTLLHVMNDIVINKKKQVIEFGSGISTIYIAKLIKSLNLDIQFYSVESNQNWISELNDLLERYEIEAFVKIIYAPILNVSNEYTYKNQKSWYDFSTIENEIRELNSIDLILVDGPSGSNTSYARYPAIPFLIDKASKDLSVFLDDTNRKAEKEIFIEWKKYLKADIKTEKKYSYLHRGSMFNAKPILR